MIRETPILLLLAAAVAFSGLSTSAAPSSGEAEEGPLLSTFKGVHREFVQQPDGVYRFSFSLPQQDRHENRDADGKVTGSFSFVDNSGEEFSVKYDADEDGFRPESDALPEIPEDTDDVQSAREEFLSFYEQTVKFLEALSSDEDDEDSSSSSSEESDEYGDEEEDNEDEDDSDSDSDSESDEEDSDEDDDEDDDEEDEDEEENEGGEEEDEEEEEGSERSPNDFFRSKFNRGFGSRVRQQELSRAAPSKPQKRHSGAGAIFPPAPSAAASVFGRRTVPKTQ